MLALSKHSINSDQEIQVFEDLTTSQTTSPTTRANRTERTERTDGLKATTETTHKVVFDINLLLWLLFRSVLSLISMSESVLLLILFQFFLINNFYEKLFLFFLSL